MSTQIALVLFVVACGGATASAPVDEALGIAAYDAKNWRECARIYEALAAQHAKPAPAEAFYAAASCEALAGLTDAAFKALDASIAAGFRDGDVAMHDADLSSLHSDPRWNRIAPAIHDQFARWERSLGEPALRRELLARRDRDQVALNALNAAPKDAARLATWKTLNHENNVWLKEVIAKYGWPGNRLAGEDGANAAWLLVQHVDGGTGDGSDPEAVAFQKICLARMEPLVKTGDVSAVDYAFLYDRVAVGEHRPQRYGTQFAGRRPRPIEDEAHLDERRHAMGMPPMAVYTAKMMRILGPEPTAPAIPAPP